jgi:Uma2 family endonuclease
MLTVQEYMQLPEVVNDEQGRFELLNGEVVEMGETTPWHNIVRGQFARSIAHFIEAPRLGWVLEETAIRLDSNNAPRADVAFWDSAHWACVDYDIAPVQVIPQLVIEIASPSNKVTDLFDKAAAYLRAGVEIVWVVIRRPYEIHVFEASGGRRIVRSGEKLEAPSVLPGFCEDASHFLPK